MQARPSPERCNRRWPYFKVLILTGRQRTLRELAVDTA